jgi:hypothetical protein
MAEYSLAVSGCAGVIHRRVHPAEKHGTGRERREIMNIEEINQLTEEIIGAAIEVDRTLGPGLLESAYETYLSFELAERGLKNGVKRLINT